MSFCSDKELAALATALGSKSAASAFCEKLTTLNATATDTTTADALLDLAEGVNQQFLVWAGALVFVMHGGFAMLCAGAIRSKNTMNILLQTILDACVSAIAFYLVGYGFAYGWGDEPNRFIGSNLFGLARWKTQNPSATGTPGWTNWFFQWAFAATATTIPAGAVAERFNFNAYLAYSAFIPAFVYPVVVRWAWSNRGWLGAWRARDPLFDYGYVDFAGSGVVHMVGGLSGLMGAIMVGPRLGRFDSNGNPVDMPGHSATLLVLGTVLLWFGWYGFNPGSVLLTTTATLGRVSSRAAVLTTISGATGGLTALLSAFFRHKAWDLASVCNGTLVGFVTITGGCHVLEPWAAIIAGSTGAILFDAICALFLKLQIDDPLSAAPMHAGTGAWGLFLIGFLAKKEYLQEVYAKSDSYGVFYGGGGKLLACQIIGIIVIAAWVCGLMGPFFYVLKVLGKLRISPEEEQAGLDVSKHGGSAYNYDHGLGKPDKPAFQA